MELFHSSSRGARLPEFYSLVSFLATRWAPKPPDDGDDVLTIVSDSIDDHIATSQLDDNEEEDDIIYRHWRRAVFLTRASTCHDYGGGGRHLLLVVSE